MLSALVLAAALYDPQTGALKVDRGILSAPLSGELSAAARAWALARRAELGLPPGSTLVSAESFGTKFGASFHLQQQLDGVDVYGANLVVTIDAHAQVSLVTSSLVAYREARRGWVIDPREALLRAARQVAFAALQPDGTPYGGAKKVFFPVGDEVHAGWLVHVPTIDLRQYILVRLDATTGETLMVQDRVFHAGLEANVYAISPGGLDAGVGVTPTVKVTLTHGDGGSMLSEDAGSVLIGDQLDSYNCCLVAGCDRNAPDAGPARSKGTTTVPNPFIPGTNLTVKFDVVSCDFQHLATNDPTRHDAGTFEYAPVDPPAPGGVTVNDPASTDEFAEVQAFYQVNREYDWVRGLSTAAQPLYPGNQPAIVPFKMRDERLNPSRKPAIWSNVVFPDFNAIIANIACVFDMDGGCVINSFTRIDNAAFVPKENFGQIPLPSYRNDVDTLMIFQGDKADFGYDSPVLWHEFGHGVVYSTANLSLASLALDNRSANNEGGAMHEAFGDYHAGAFGLDPLMGRYVGPRLSNSAGMTGIQTDSFLRNLDNQLSCPDVLHGEVHDDSQHVAGALWRARHDQFQGSDQGARFDAAFYAMLVSLSTTADFAQFAQVMAAHVDTAFPDGGVGLTELFKQRGVVGCSKVVDMTNAPARPTYGIGTRGQAQLTSGPLPGPHQLKLRVPNGTRSVTVSASVGGGGLGGLGGAAPVLKVLAKVGAPITFTRAGAALQNDADKTVDLPAMNGSATATFDLAAPCGASSEVFVTVANDGTNAANLGNLAISAQPATSCTSTDGGSNGDGGTTDGGTGTTITPGITMDGGPSGVFEGPGLGGCGCGASPVGAPLVLLLLALRRRFGRWK
ncbi:MAG: hypothetical protein IPJ65_13325 [Archangiaceae bacterium]|nr:hypothetical protein [Archangiaceae bacterium]